VTSFLDLGTGNGALLFGLRDAGWDGPMLGVDYSPQSVRFAKRIEQARRKEREQEQERERDGDGDGGEDANKTGEEDDEEAGAEEVDKDDEVDVHFAEHDILRTPAQALLDARFSPSVVHGWAVVLDKGTFDAISLSAETLDATSHAVDGGNNDDTANNSNNNTPRRVNEVYGSRVLPLLREGGLFLITSCNWTEAELRDWFEKGSSQEIPISAAASTSGTEEGQDQKIYWGFEVAGRVEYRSFSFGGVKGQTISTLCFRKVRKER
jgi:SAM-dependent methyltransferase